MLFQSNVQWEPTFLLNIMSVRVAGWVPTRTRRVSWSVSPVLKEPPQPTCTPAASLSAKVQNMHMNRKTSVFLCSDLNVFFHIWDFFSVSFGWWRGDIHLFSGQCKPGSHSRNGLEICESCPLGHFQPSFGARKCEVCPDETSTVTRGAVDETECGGDIVWQA